MIYGGYGVYNGDEGKGPFVFQSVLVALVLALMLLDVGFKVGASVVAHVECSQVTKGKVMKSNTSPWQYCHIYER